MKRKVHFLIFLIYLLFLFQKALPQCGNLIVNHSFENAAFSFYEDNYPMEPHQIYQVNPGSNDEYLQAWQTDQRHREESGNDKWVHSPDWFKTGFNSQNIPFHFMGEEWINPDPYGTNIPTTAIPHTGNCYIGMNDAELVEQKLSDNLEEGKKYNLEMYVRPVRGTRGMGVYNGYYPTSYGWSGGAKFRAWLAKDKIKSKHVGCNEDIVK